MSRNFFKCQQIIEIWLATVADDLLVQYCRLIYIYNTVIKENKVIKQK